LKQQLDLSESGLVSQMQKLGMENELSFMNEGDGTLASNTKQAKGKPENDTDKEELLRQLRAEKEKSARLLAEQEKAARARWENDKLKKEDENDARLVALQEAEARLRSEKDNVQGELMKQLDVEKEKSDRLLSLQQAEAKLNQQKDKVKKDQSLYLKPSQKLLDEVVVVGYGFICKHERGCICGCCNKKNKKSNDIMSIIPSKPFIKEGIRMYPNPALKNSSIHIVINEIGKCELLLTDNQSRLICSKQFTIKSAKETYLFNLPNEIASGIYYIRLINKESKKQWLEKLIVQ
jgi:hypothetical protein